MATVYVVRHCEALGNLTRKFQGQVDNDITETGELQLKYLADRFENIHIDAFYASPLMRAHKTALSVAERKGMPVTLMDGLKELHLGIFENMSFETFRNEYKEHHDKWVNAPWSFEAPSGESMSDLYERVWQTVKQIAEENSGKTVFIASHGCAIRNFMCRVLYNDISRLSDVEIGNNTAVTKLVFDDDMNVTVEYCSDSSHLPPEALPETSKFVIAK